MQKVMSLFLIAMLIAIVGCKKDDSSSSPTSSNNTTTTSHLLGSGSISFTAGSLGSLSFSGSWAGTSSGSSGTGVEALTGSSATYVAGYTWHSSSNWDIATLLLWTNGTGTRTNSSIASDFSFTFVKGGTSATDQSNSYSLTLGTCNVTNFSSSGMQGTFSGTATNSQNNTVSVTNGSFNVTFGTQSYY